MITDVQSALDIIGSAWEIENCKGVVVLKNDVDESFFDLKTRIAGEILQKFANYNMRIVIAGDLSGYISKSLRDFVYECNKGKTVNFTATVDEAIEILER
jgi:hypothetical protein